jgi:hypothetical protein
MQRFIVVPRGEEGGSSLVEFIRVCRNDGECSVIKVVGEEASPRRAIVEMSETAQERLSVQYKSALIIEGDEPLSY